MTELKYDTTAAHWRSSAKNNQQAMAKVWCRFNATATPVMTAATTSTTRVHALPDHRPVGCQCLRGRFVQCRRPVDIMVVAAGSVQVRTRNASGI
jgi:hypothetical protein